jgi:glutamate synthase (NADPH/NADH) small chain
MPCELLLIAAGFVGCEDSTLTRFSLTADGRGRLLSADGTHHLGGKLFCAGDLRNGQSLVVRALADGRAAAKEADAFLNG